MKANRNVLKRRMLKRRKDWRCWCKSYWMRVGSPSVRIVKSCSLLVTTQWLTSAERTEMPNYSVWFKTELLLIHEGRVSSCWGLFWRRRQISCHGAQNTVFLCLTELKFQKKKKLNGFWSIFNVWMNNQNLSPRANCDYQRRGPQNSSEQQFKLYCQETHLTEVERSVAKTDTWTPSLFKHPGCNLPCWVRK